MRPLKGFSPPEGVSAEFMCMKNIKTPPPLAKPYIRSCKHFRTIQINSEPDGESADRVPCCPHVDEERVHGAGPRYIQTAREVSQSPGKILLGLFYYSFLNVKEMPLMNPINIVFAKMISVILIVQILGELEKKIRLNSLNHLCFSKF